MLLLSPAKSPRLVEWSSGFGLVLPAALLLPGVLLLGACTPEETVLPPPGTPTPTPLETPTPDATPDATPEVTPTPDVLPEMPALDTVHLYPNLAFDGLTNLVDPNDGSGRLFITQQEGRIYTLPKDQLNEHDVEPEVYLDIRERVSTADWEAGLLGLAFHPRFSENGLFYVYYSVAGEERAVLSRFSAAADDPSTAGPDSEQVILEVEQPYGNHNGGQLAFGPDGYLYLSLGDGGSKGDPHGHGQNLGTLLGSIIRIDVDREDQGRPYAIPPGNPFLDDPDARDEIWAHGFRNPWRFSFDRGTDSQGAGPAGGVLWVADVGENVWESLYMVEPGRNYGWNTVEGPDCFPPGNECDMTGLELPLHAYRLHEEGDCSVIGGYVYRGTAIQALRGTYVFGDFCSGRIWGLRLGPRSEVEHRLLAESGHAITSFGEDADGELYVVTHDGRIHQLVARNG